MLPVAKTEHFLLVPNATINVDLIGPTLPKFFLIKEVKMNRDWVGTASQGTH
ncbi:hypothetical protein [Haliscomenobacter sp.]|uniref:hypothetical protein n=1 Tax=Haliscomenobacter sp. TaxID=2717303 RepID=UPI003BA9E039